MKKKLLVIGHGRHGKDTVCEILRDEYGYTFESSSKFCSKLFIYDDLKDKYEYADEEGPSKSLRVSSQQAQPILQKGDLLVTSGYDGIFPKGLHVAIVSFVQNLNEEDYSYELEAHPICKNIDYLEKVFILPPIH